MSGERGERTGSTYEQWKLAVRFLGEWINDIEAGLQEILTEIERVSRVSKMPRGRMIDPARHRPQPMRGRGYRGRYPDLMIGGRDKK